MIPRSPSLKTAYRSAKFQRPKLKIHGVWAFGFVLRIAVLEENTYHGSGLVQELLALTIEDIMKVCDEKKVAAPDTLVVVGDNTVKELKNTVLLSGVANYVNHSHFRCLDAVISPWNFIGLILDCFVLLCLFWKFPYNVASSGLLRWWCIVYLIHTILLVPWNDIFLFLVPQLDIYLWFSFWITKTNFGDWWADAWGNLQNFMMMPVFVKSSVPSSPSPHYQAG